MGTVLRAGVMACAVMGGAFGLGGCHSKSSATPDNFIKGLNAHFLEHPDCLFPEAPTFPLETNDAAKKKQMDALVSSQLLQVTRDVQVSRYVTTPMGERVAPRFCYGHRVATAIDSFTPPAPRNGFPETDVVYRYHMEDLPMWARSEEMRQAFPKMAQQAGGDSTDKATLAGTMAGWQVPD